MKENIEANSLPISNSYKDDKKINVDSKNNREFLLIDLRSKEDFEDFHIKEALNVPEMHFN